MGAPLLGHLDPRFLALMDRVQASLRGLYGTDHRFTLPVSGTGSAGMECCIANLVHPGDRVVVGVHGVFGRRMVDLVGRMGAEAVAVESPFGEPLRVDKIRRAAHAAPTAVVAMVHAETSTGVLQPIQPVGEIAREVDALLVVDAVTSLGGAAVDVDAHGIDAAYSGTQKCLSAPPGLAPVTFSDRALERAATRTSPCPSWYLDVGLLGGYWGGERAYHHTAPISMVYALAESLAAIEEEGLDACRARHRQVADAFYRGLAALDLECLVTQGLRTPMLTSVRIPDGVDDARLRRELLSAHGIEIGGGLGSLAGKVWRVGLMGHGARPERVVRLLLALGECLGRQGRVVSATEAIAAAFPG